MNASQLPPELLGPLKQLVEGETEPAAWLTWWDENEARVEAAVSRGAFLRLRPRSDRRVGPNFTIVPSQEGARRLMQQLAIDCAASDRYQIAGKQEFDVWSAARKAREQARKQAFLPVLKTLEGGFPNLARFLRRRLERIERMEGGAAEEQIARVEAVLGRPLPGRYRDWLSAVRVLELEGLTFGAEHPFSVDLPTSPAHGMLCIADYALEADGDQVLLDPQSAGDDPPVFYYAHGVPKVRTLAPSFTAWIESLPKSSVLRDD